jgi:ParB-like nuclease domain
LNKLAVTLRPVADLVPYARNARTHSESQIEAICLSLKEFGWTNPVLVDGSNGIIAGHGRVLAAKKLGMAEVPCIELAHLSPEQRRAYVIADNQTLDAAGFDLAPLGFEVGELAAVRDTRPVGATDPDEAPAAPVNPVSATGDLWALGRHRVLCGDATSAEDVKRLLNGAKPHLMVTDPPYGVEYDANWRNERFRADATPIGGRAIGKVTNDDEADWRAAFDLFAGGPGWP